MYRSLMNRLTRLTVTASAGVVLMASPVVVEAQSQAQSQAYDTQPHRIVARPLVYDRGTSIQPSNVRVVAQSARNAQAIQAHRAAEVQQMARQVVAERPSHASQSAVSYHPGLPERVAVTSPYRSRDLSAAPDLPAVSTPVRSSTAGMFSEAVDVSQPVYIAQTNAVQPQQPVQQAVQQSVQQPHVRHHNGLYTTSHEYHSVPIQQPVQPVVVHQHVTHVHHAPRAYHSPRVVYAPQPRYVHYHHTYHSPCYKPVYYRPQVVCHTTYRPRHHGYYHRSHRTSWNVGYSHCSSRSGISIRVGF